MREGRGHARDGLRQGRRGAGARSLLLLLLLLLLLSLLLVRAHAKGKGSATASPHRMGWTSRGWMTAVCSAVAI